MSSDTPTSPAAAQSRSAAETETPTGADDSPRATFLIIAASVFYFVTAGVSFPVLPELVKETSGGANTEIGLAFASLGFGMFVARPFVGYLNDRFGRRPMVMTGAVFCAVTQFLHVEAAEVGLSLLYATRFINGLGGSVMYVGMATIATEMPSPERRARVFSWFSAAVFLGFAIGPLLGEALLRASGFQAAYTAAAAVMVLVALCAMALPETRPADANPTMGGLAAIFHPVGMRAGAACFVAILAFMGFQGFLKQWGLELGVRDVAPILSTYAVATLILRATASRALDGNRLRVGTFAYVGLIASSLLLATANGAPQLYLAAVVLAVGSAFATPLLMLIAADSAPAAARARVMSTVVFANDMGSTVGVPLLGVIADAAGFPTMFVVVAVASVVALAWFRSPAITGLSGISSPAAGR